VAGLTVLDASILVAHFDASDAHHTDAGAVIAGADELAASVLTLAEAAVDAVRTGRLDEQLGALIELEVRSVALGADSAPALARLRADTGLRMPDCCVLQAAAVVGADAIGTRDRRLAKAARERGYETP
jgi:toxin FitB